MAIVKDDRRYAESTMGKLMGCSHNRLSLTSHSTRRRCSNVLTLPE